MLVRNHSFFDESSRRVIGLDQRHGEYCAAIHAKGFLHPWSRAEFDTLLAAPECVSFGYPDGFASGKPGAPNIRLIGFIIAKIAADEAEILTFAVDPLEQRQGIGSFLLDALMKEMASKKVQQLFLEVNEANSAARALYEKAGFKTVGIRKAYYRTNDSRRTNALIMMTRLSAAVSSPETNERGQRSKSDPHNPFAAGLVVPHAG